MRWWRSSTKGEELHPFSHIDDAVFSLFHCAHKLAYTIIDIRLEVLQGSHRVCGTYQTPVLAMHFFVPTSKQIKLAVTLPDTVPITLAELCAGTIDGLDGTKIRYADLVGSVTDERAVFLVPVSYTHLTLPTIYSV